jgi:hypothetical protein
MAGSAGEALRVTLEGIAADPPPAPASRLYAIGWATVELDRAERELTAELGLAPGTFIEAPDSGVLGAHCRVARDTFPGGVALAILEPSTEGRLSAALARHGEAPLAAWFVEDGGSGAVMPPSTVAPSSRLAPAAPATPATPALPTVPGTRSTAAGPFGPERIVSDGPIHGLRRLLVGVGAGTIRA